MSKINQLSNAIKFALFVGATASVATASAFAQAKEETAELKAVEVTGSRIRRSVEEEGSSPVQIVSRAQIEATGLNNIADVLSQLSSVDGSGLSTVTTQTNGSDGSQQISLRNLGANRTLILVDGSRWATDINGIVDLSTVPVAIIERIEILKDGASAIYGSDAIAGVINLITRKNYDGAQVGLSYGQTVKGDGARTGIDLTIGANGERSNSVLSVSYTTQETIFAGDRKISRVVKFGDVANWAAGQAAHVYYGLAPIPSGTCDQVLNSSTDAFDPILRPGGPRLGLGGLCGSATGLYGSFSVVGSAFAPNGSYAFNHATGTAITGTTAVTGTQLAAANYHIFQNADRFNFAPINYLQQPAERFNISANSRFDFTDTLSGWIRANYTKRTSSQQLAPVPLTINANGANGPQWAFPISATSLFNPFGVDIRTASYRMLIAGPRKNNFDYDTFALQLGLEGNFNLGERTYNWELMAQRNDGQYDQNGENYTNLFNLRNALGPSGYNAATNEIYCGTSFAARIQGCTPFNIFGGPTGGLGYRIPGAVATRTLTAAEVAAAVNYVSYTLVSQQGNTTTNFKGGLTGDLFELPGGMSGFAFGVEYRKDDAFQTPDALVAEGGSSTNFAAATRGETSLKEFYAEALFPILKDVTGFQELELSVAARSTKYNAKGLADATPFDTSIATTFLNKPSLSDVTPKVGLKWKPIDDLLIRASWGETFRAPSANDLFGGVGEGFPAAADPCQVGRYGAVPVGGRTPTQIACDADTGLVGVGAPAQPNGQIRALVGSNFELKPEHGENVSLGFVYSPSYLENFNIALDLWKTDLKDAITGRTPGQLNGLCFTQTINGLPASATNPLINDPVSCAGVVRDVTGFLVSYNLLQYNAQRIKTRGVDLGMGYKFDTSIGDFRVQWDTTYTDQYKLQASEFVPGFAELTGIYNGSPYWRFRSNLNVNWNKGDFSASWTTRFLSDIYEAACITACNSRAEDGLGNDQNGNPIPRNHSGNYAVHDVQVAWKAPWNAKLAVGARNLFGKEPPLFTNNTFAHSFDASYDLPGGAYWYAQYRQDF
jgi:iron complex outermembrane recepter protein